MSAEQQQTFTALGRRLRFTAVGSGPPLVLVHGLSGSARWWRYNVPAFSRQHTVYTLELLGGVGVQEAAELIALWLRDQRLQHVCLIGHSMGGQIAMNVAARSPQVTRLVLACASGLLRGEWWKLARYLPRAGLVGRPRFLPTILGDSLRTGWPNLYRAVRDLLRDDVALVLPHIWQPTLIIWGSRDPLVPPALGEMLAHQIQHSRYLVLPAGHVVMVDQPAAFNAAVLDFLESPHPENLHPEDLRQQ